jgi:hypothetical protein
MWIHYQVRYPEAVAAAAAVVAAAVAVATIVVAAAAAAVAAAAVRAVAEAPGVVGFGSRYRPSTR